MIWWDDIFPLSGNNIKPNDQSASDTEHMTAYERLQ